MEPDDWLDLVGERSREEAEMTLTLFFQVIRSRLPMQSSY